MNNCNCLLQSRFGKNIITWWNLPIFKIAQPPQDPIYLGCKVDECPFSLIERLDCRDQSFPAKSSLMAVNVLLIAIWYWWLQLYLYTAINDNNRIKSTHKHRSFLSGLVIEPLQLCPILKEGVHKSYRKNVNAMIDCGHYIYSLHDFFELIVCNV